MFARLGQHASAGTDLIASAAGVGLWPPWR
jgi:hypothetical protein